MEATMSKGRRNFLVFLISVMCQLIYIVPYIRFYFYDQYIEAFGLTNLQLGNLASIYGLVALFSYFVGGFLADRFSIRMLMTVSFVMCAGLAFWEATYPSYATLVVIYGLFAFFNSATMWTAYIKFLRTLGTDEEQGRIFGTSEAIRGVLGSVAGLSLLAVVMQFSTIQTGIQAIIVILGISYVVFAGLSFIFLPEKDVTVRKNEPSNQEVAKKGTFENFKKAVKMPDLWILAVFMFACYCTFMAGVNYLSTYTTQILGISPELASGLGIIRNYGILVIAGILGGVLADKNKSRILFIVYTLAIVAVLAIIMPLSRNMVMFSLVISMVLALFYYTVKSVYFSVMGDAGIPLALTGIASGLLSFVAFTPDAFMTTLMGAWLDNDLVRGFNMIFIWMVTWAIIAIVFALIIYKRSQKRRRESEIQKQA